MEEGVEVIGQSAFSGCEKLKNVSMPESLKEIKSSAFQSNPVIEEIQIPSKIRKIDNYTFYGNAKLKKIILPESLEIIKVGAFSHTGFEEIVIPEKIKEIEVGAFDENFELNNIIIRGKNPQYIYENGMLMTINKDDILFISDKYLKTINTFKIPDGIIKFNINLNKYTNITKIIIPEKIENIVSHNFPNSINEIELSNTNNTYDINESKKILYRKDTKEIIICYSKEENINLEEEDISKIEKHAFKQAVNAKNIILPNSLKIIGSEVFTNCKKIEEIKIGKNVDNINPLFKYNNYSGKVTIDKNNSNYIIENDILYNINKTKLYTVLYSIEGEFYVDKNVEKIDQLAFHNQNKMTKISLPKGVKEIGNSFNYCGVLTEVNIPGTVEKISESAFNGCANLNSINIDRNKDSILGAPWGAIKGMKVVK